MSSKPLEVWVPITELPTLVEKKSKQTDLNDTLEPLSLPIKDLPYPEPYLFTRYHSRFFVQVGHETTYAAIGNHHFFTKTCHCQIYQNY